MRLHYSTVHAARGVPVAERYVQLLGRMVLGTHSSTSDPVVGIARIAIRSFRESGGLSGRGEVRAGPMELASSVEVRYGSERGPGALAHADARTAPEGRRVRRSDARSAPLLGRRGRGGGGRLVGHAARPPDARGPRHPCDATLRVSGLVSCTSPDRRAPLQAPFSILKG